MRIVAGKHRGRVLASPLDNTIRPTTDRVRESLFSILESNFPDVFHQARILDLFAGTGALGLEAISRGAEFAAFVELSQKGFNLIRRNINLLDVGDQTRILRADATRMGALAKMHPFSLVFADPPYNKGLTERSVTCLIRDGWLDPGALIVIEDAANSQTPQLPKSHLMDERLFGDTKIWIMQFKGDHK